MCYLHIFPAIDAATQSIIVQSTKNQIAKIARYISYTTQRKQAERLPTPEKSATFDF